MGKNPSRFKGDNRPVEQVSWHDAQEFIQQLNDLIQALQPEYGFRLPDEAEWEYACRARSETPFNFDGELTLGKVNYRGPWDDYGQWGQGALQETAEVKSYACNAWGLFEMHGNVWEWCQNYWSEQLPEAPGLDLKGPDTGAERVMRGGSWDNDGRRARSACRNKFGAGNCYSDLGFRLALGLELRPG
jgi:formylglycine-generating enzyme required for sulfatase activity